MPKIKIVHLLLDTNFKNHLSDKSWNDFMIKQNKSLEYFSDASMYFYSYKKIFNQKSTFAPIETCNTPECYVESPELAPSKGAWVSTGHYGAFEAHRNAILNEFDDDLDAMLIVEGDVISNLKMFDFSNEIKDAFNFGLNKSASFFTFAQTKFGEGSENKCNTIPYGKYDKIKHFLCCNCYLIFRSEIDNLRTKISNAKWMSFDVWLYWNYDGRVPIFKTHTPIAYETSGFSLIDFKEKESNYLP